MSFFRGDHFRLRALGAVLCLCALIGAWACAGGNSETAQGTRYPTGISDDIQKVLKYDARVQDFDLDGDLLSVNVNESWVAQPQGMHERALGQWYSLLKASHGDKARIVVKYEGNEVDTYTADKGYQPASKEKKESSES